MCRRARMRPIKLEKGEQVPTYVIRLNHPPDQCPSSNSKVRERVEEIGPQIPKIAERLGVKMIAGPLVLGSEHEGLAIVESDRVETVNDFVDEAGLGQWNSVRVSTARSLPEAMGELTKLPAPLY